MHTVWNENNVRALTMPPVHATVVLDTKSGTPGSETVKVKAAIAWVGVVGGVNAEVRMYDRLFSDAQRDAGGKDFIESLNPNSLKVVTAIVEPSLANALPASSFSLSGMGALWRIGWITCRGARRCSTCRRG